MSEKIRISLFEVVGSPFCVASDDGQKIYERLAVALERISTLHFPFTMLLP